MKPWQEEEQQLAHELRQQFLVRLRLMSSGEMMKIMPIIGRDDMPSHTHTCSRCKKTSVCEDPQICFVTGPVICLGCVKIATVDGVWDEVLAGVIQ